MQIPKRQSETNKKFSGSDDNYLTEEAIAELKNELQRLEKSMPKAREEVSRTQAMGDLSENAAYQEAKARLRGIDGRIFAIREKLKHAVVISKSSGNSGIISIGSTVVLDKNGQEITYQILGSHETDPRAGKISHLSPIGAALLNHTVGDTVKIQINGNDMEYKIIKVR